VSATASSSGPRRGVDKQQEYVEQKYGTAESHVNLTKEQVEGMLNRVLEESTTVKYLLESLKMVGRVEGPDRRSSETEGTSHHTPAVEGCA
jgi:hypothetical protein